MRLKFTKSQVMKFMIALLLLACMLYANFYAVRGMLRCGVEVYFYDKLLVAYNIGGERGMGKELTEILATEKMPRVLVLAADFDVSRRGLADPKQFLQEKVEQNKKKANLIRGLRSAAIALMTLVFFWQLLANWLKKRQTIKKGASR